MNLSEAIHKAKTEDFDLTDTQKEDLYALLAKGRRQPTRSKLSRVIFDLSLCLWPDAGILHRVHLDENGVSYCAGQSYPEEITIVKKVLLGEI